MFTETRWASFRGDKVLDQIRRAIDILSLLWIKWDGGPHQEGYLLLVDLQKAFDTVDWSYLFEVLR